MGPAPWLRIAATPLGLLALLLARPAGAQVVLKLGTLAPVGSAWHEVLKDVGKGFSDASGGAVKLRIYAGGVQGNEGEMIRKMGIGQLQAASLSNVGMHDITPEPKALSIPLFFADEAEAECAFERLRPSLEAALERKGFSVLHWSRLGTLHLFCTRPRPAPGDMADAGLFVQEGDPGAAEMWRAAGFRPVVLSATDLLPALQTGMVECVPSLPVYVLAARLFEKASHMSDLAWGWMYGATIVRREAWEKVPAERRAILLDVARRGGLEADAVVRRLNAEAVEAMGRQGLRVTAIDPGPWRRAMARVHPLLRDTVVPAPFLDELSRAREACRGRGGAPPTR